MRRALGLALVLAAALPAPAGATLVYTRQGTSVQATPRIFAAADDGSAPLRIAAGYDPQVSPDGRVVAYLARPAPAFRDELRIVPAAGGRSRTLLRSAQILSVRFSPDSTRVAAEVGQRRLVVLDLATGAQSVVARGFIQGLSWSPSGEEIVYGRGENDSYTAPSDLYAVPARGGEARRLTTDRRSLEPVWGAGGIAYVKQRRRRLAPRYDIWVRDAIGGIDRRLTAVPADPLVNGLMPLEFSADGTRLLASYVGQDTSVGYAVTLGSGRARALSRDQENGLVAFDVSADGRTILAHTGGPDPSLPHDVVAVPWGGGRTRVLARRASFPDWTR